MRPRVMSYGVISTWTLSPGRMRMRCMRIFPELCARTVYPFSNSTRNMALGRGSTTVPSTVNASSFGLLRFFLLISSQRGVREQNSLTDRPRSPAPRSAFYSTGKSEKRKKMGGVSEPPPAQEGSETSHQPNGRQKTMCQRPVRAVFWRLERVVIEPCSSLQDELFEA